MSEPLQGARRHKLLPADIKAKLPKLYAQDGKGENAIVYLKLFSPYLNETIYITEGQQEGEDFEFFGWHSKDRELQYMSFNLLAAAAGMRGRLPLYERDRYFTPTTLRECKEKDL